MYICTYKHTYIHLCFPEDPGETIRFLSIAPGAGGVSLFLEYT